MSFLALEGLSKDYAGSFAVNGLSLAVARGEFVALLGPSGCGKTTTLQMVAGFVAPSAGRILLDGRDLTHTAAADRGMGIVFQSYALFPHMTAAENVGFGLEMRKTASTERRQRVAEALDLVGLSGLADRYPRRMSGGQQQRVALARALVIRPSILLLDEPLSNLDAKLREGMQIELRQIQRSLGTTTLLVTHDQGEAMALADRVLVMNAGRVEQIGTPQEVYEWPHSAFVADFLGRSNVLKAIVAGGKLRLGEHACPLEWLRADGISPNAGEVQISVRPEKISILSMDAGQVSGMASSLTLSGTVQTRIFQGHHWLYQVQTPMGLLTVTYPNAGGDSPGESQSVILSWRPEDMRIRSKA